MKRIYGTVALVTGLVAVGLGIAVAGNDPAQGEQAERGSEASPNETVTDQSAYQQIEAQAPEQERVQAVLQELVPQLEQSPGFAGVWVEPELDWTVHIATTSSVDALASILAPFQNRGVPLQVQTVSYTKKELSELHYQIAEAAEAWRARGVEIVTVGFNAKLNRVRLRIQPADEAAVAALIREYGDRVVIEESLPFQTSACTSRNNCAAPIKGGLSVNSQSGYGCTSGFVTRDIAWAGAAYMMFAGHCVTNGGGIGPSWLHNASAFGTANSNQFAAGSSTDSGYILLSAGASPGNQLFVSTSDIRSMTGFIPNVSQTVGTWACKSGRTTNYTCGQIIDDDVSLTTSGVLLHHQWIADYSSAPDDSGGPIMFSTNGHGIHSSSNGAGLSSYSTMDWIRFTTGKTMCVTATC